MAIRLCMVRQQLSFPSDFNDESSEDTVSHFKLESHQVDKV
jgi:hypothetical protein